MDFEKLFAALTEHEPFPWQTGLYECFCRGDIPAICDIPTGLGKTSVIAIWLLALAGKRSEVKIPRRLVYVVNRRTIVDQATEVVIGLQARLREAAHDGSSPLNGTARLLKTLCALGDNDGELVSVSTLRGELADNLQWRFDPTRPAVMIGTVDMIGSKLLFSGYGDSARIRPLNAGLIGCDTLIVHDESHLTPAFSRALRSIENFQKKAPAIPGIPPFKVIELSATNRETEDSILQITSADRDNEKVKARYFAVKRLHFHEIEKSGDLAPRIVELALKHSPDKTRVVIFVHSPEDATKIHRLLVEEMTKMAEEEWRNETGTGAMPKKDKDTLASRCNERVSILTGEIRGYERDRLLETKGMLPFTGKSVSEKTVFLVSTSAGEVGMDLHADHMVSDLSTLDSMIQRLGRVNRFGQTEARVDVVYEKSIRDKGNVDDPRGKTLKLLERRMNTAGGEPGLNVSPAALYEIMSDEAASEAFAAIPDMVEVTDILLDLWSQTSLTTVPARAEVAPWLHGIQENLPETWMAWRHELSLLADSDLTDDEIARWFQRYPISSSETLRRPTSRLKWSTIAEKQWVEDHENRPVFILYPNGQGRKMTIKELAEQRSRLNFAKLVFPSQLGGLNESGFFDIKAKGSVKDVADETVDRIVVEKIGDNYRLAPIAEWLTQHEPERADSSESRNERPRWTTLRNAVQTAEKNFNKKAILKLKVRQAMDWEDEPHELWLLLLKEMARGGPVAQKAYAVPSAAPSIDEHNRATAAVIKSMTETTELPSLIKEALHLAASHHDIGKAHARWQTAAGHPPESYFAKSGPGGIDWRILDGYRHELGSLMNVLEIPTIQEHPERDLILHLIATHHGWGRPHFEDRAFPIETDPETRNRTNIDIMTRYVRLQERFGYWRLAWLEALLRRADGIASMRQGANEEASDE